ncbi:MAG: cysteine desulfurase family protein [Firmicutes bacterium]|nr:cysteine desulfurase family protein [Bacillota bacterium]
MAAIYLDNAATTPLDPRVAQAMHAFMEAETFGNPSSIHGFGREARMHLEQARATVAKAIGAEPSEIVFTSGGTEADFLALTGLMAGSGRSALVASAIEHHAVLHTAEWMAENATVVSYVRPGAQGVVSVVDVLAQVSERTGLVSLMWVNNETGAIQPIEALAAALAERGVALHTDAIQALPTLPIDVSGLPVSSLSMSGHKIAGPKGVGALYLRKGTPYRSPLRGGSQERGRRAGTENLAGIIGFARAMELLMQERTQRVTQIQRLRERLITGLKASVEGVLFHGAQVQAPQIVHFAIPGLLAQTVLMNLDLAGIAASSGSACTAGSIEPSHVLLAEGCADALLKSSLRFSLSASNTVEEIDQVVTQLAAIVLRLRKH